MPKISMKAARVNANLTQEEMAEKLGISREYLISIENGKVDIKPYMLLAFCHIVGMSEDDIILPIKST